MELNSTNRQSSYSAYSLEGETDMKERILDESLIGKILTAEEAAETIIDGMTVATSGFTPSGYPKAVPLALAKRVRNTQEKMEITLIAGASVGDELDGELSREGIIKRRIPYQTNESIRSKINRGEIQFIDQHLSHVAQNINYNFIDKIDVAIIEAIKITEEGNIIPSTSIGISPTIVDKAKNIIIEVNMSQPLELEGIHDIYTIKNPPFRKPIPIINCFDRIGSNYIPLNKEKISGIVITDIKDNVRPLAPVNDNNKIMAGILMEFLDFEIRKGRIPKELLPLQSGVGSVANAVLKGFLNSKYDNLQFYTEVIQDSILDLVEAGRVCCASGTAITPSPEKLKEILLSMKRYRDKIILRPQEISNHPEIIRRLGVIAMNTAIEVDIYGNVNSTNVLGGNMMNGIGGSGDFARNAYLSIFFTESIRKDAHISTIVPLVSHHDHTEHDVDVVITERGIADLRGLSPKERAKRIIENCAHPDYKDQLREYYNRASRRRGHIPILLNEAFSWHCRFESVGTMKNDTGGKEYELSSN